MKVIESIKGWRIERKELSGSVGFVPTMGALHVGHASLIERARRENDHVVVSIFVNPLQFNEATDYQNYPKTLAADRALLESLGVDYLFLPQESTIYPVQGNFTLKADHVMARILEGEQRPGHFEGVLTVVLKLLNIVTANRAYFGEKDFQQYVLIESMTQYLFLDVDIIPCATVREQSSLPFSSRNKLLSSPQKNLAAQAAQIIHEISAATIADSKKELQDLGFVVEYLEIVDERVFSAIRIGEVRLIDNFVLQQEKIC